MKKKSTIIIAIILMSIGFASISTALIINGNAKVSENQDDFSVIFTAASIDGKDVYSTAVDETKKIITFETSELKTLNQTSILTYEVTNNSSNYDANVTITCVSKDGTTAKYTSIKNELENNTIKILAKNSVSGTLTITLDKLPTKELTEEYTCKLEFSAVERDNIGVTLTQFEKDSWSTIAEKVKNGNTSKYHVGDTKTVNLGTFGTHTVRIANMSECTTETSETACGFVVEFADIITSYPFNNVSPSLGGWRDSEIRIHINETIYNSLPNDLQNIIVSTKVISGHGSTSGETNFETQDKLYLLSSEEIYGDFASSSNSQYDSATGTSKLLDYYKKKLVTMENYSLVIKKYNKSDFWWWLRSSNSADNYRFLVVGHHGDWYRSYVKDSCGISPAFRIA